jgi:hypothetical protein
MPPFNKEPAPKTDPPIYNKGRFDLWAMDCDKDPTGLNNWKVK